MSRSDRSCAVAGAIALVLLGALAALADPPPKPKPKPRAAKLKVAPTPSPSPTPRAAFRVEIEQGGRLLALDDHRVVLQRAPFDIVLTLAGGEFVALRASSNTSLFEKAYHGSPLGLAFIPSQTGAEAAGNPDKDLWVDATNTQHGLAYDPKEPYHRFNEVVPKGGLYRCRRSVARFGLGDGVPMESYTAPSLYLVFLSGSSSKDYMQTLEERRDFVMLTFEDATADLPPPKVPAKQGPTEAILALVFAKDVATAKAYLPEVLKSQVARRSAVEQQMFYENFRMAEVLRADGARVDQRGKKNKPVVQLESPPRRPLEVGLEKERIKGDEAILEGKVREGKESAPLEVRMVREDGRWRFAGVQNARVEKGPLGVAWSRLDDPGFFDKLDAHRRGANESAAIGDLRTFISAQAYVSSANGGFYLPPACLEALATCIPGYPGPPAMRPPYPWTAPRYGYRWTFHSGPPPKSPDSKKAKASSASVQGYALVGVPDGKDRAGYRSFCGDDSGQICVTTEGPPPAVRNGQCATPCTKLE